MARSIRRRVGSRRVSLRRSRGRRVAVRSKSWRISVGGRRRRSSRRSNRRSSRRSNRRSSRRSRGRRVRRGGFRDGHRAFDLHGAMKDGAAAFV